MFHKEEIKTCLKGLKYPAGKLEILEKAAYNGASPKLVNFIGNIPHKIYHSVEDIISELMKVPPIK